MRFALRALAALLPLMVLASNAQAQPAPASPTATAPAPTAAPGDEVLRRVLRSGCRDGVAETRALAAQGAAPWAATVARLCGEILNVPPAAAEPPEERSSPAARRERSSGRGTMVFNATLYGLWVGLATDVLIKVDDARGAILPPLLGMGLGLGISLGVTSTQQLDSGQAWAIGAGLEWGTINGACWAGGLDLSSQKVVGLTLVGGVAAGVTGIEIAEKVHPTPGDVEVARSGLLWGTVAGMLGLAALSSNGGSETTFFRDTAVATDLGFLAGVAAAASVDVSRDRMLIVDAGTLGGVFAGGGILWLTTGTSNTVNWRAVAGGALGGLAVGMVTTILLTRGMDSDDDPAPNVGALLGRDERGRWHVGAPEPVPVFDGLGRRMIGATFNAVGGTF